MTEHDKREFYRYALFVVALSIPVGHLFYETWMNGTWVYANQAATAIPWFPDGVTGVIAALLFGLGIHLGFLLVFMQNKKKYYQGILLLGGTVSAVAVLGALGLGSDFEPSLLNFISFGAGLFVVILAEMVDASIVVPVVTRNENPNEDLTEVYDDSGSFGLRWVEVELEGRMHQIDPRKSSWGNAVDIDGNQLSFPVATYGLLSFIVLLVVLSNAINIFFVLPDIGILQGIHLIFSGMFLWVLSSFIRLNPSSDSLLQILGPTQSGKTYFVLGSALEVERNDRFQMTKAEGWINQLIEDHKEWAQKNRDRDDRDIKWNIEDTDRDELLRTNFTVTTNDRIPQAFHFNVVDHAGEFLAKVANRVEPITDGGEDIEDSEEDQDLVYICEHCDYVDIPTDVSGSASIEGETCPECGIGFLTREGDLLNKNSNDHSDESGQIEDEQVIERIEDSEDDVTDANSEDDVASESDSWHEVSTTDDDESSGEAVASESDSWRDTPTTDDDESSGEDTTSESEESINHSDTVRIDEEDEDREKTSELDSSDDQSEDSTSTPNSEKGITDTSDGFDEESLLNELVPRVRDSNTLLLLLDCERLEGGKPAGRGSESLETSEMNRIVNSVEPDRVLLIATKADLLVNKWKAWHASENQDSVDAERLPDPHEVQKYQRSFRDYVTWRFKKRSPNLLSNSNSGVVYPVYFETEKDENDGDESWIPKPNRDGELEPHGYDYVLSVIAQGE